MNREFADDAVVRYAWVAQQAACRLAPRSPVAGEDQDDREQDALVAIWLAAQVYDPSRGPLLPYLRAKAAHGVINGRRDRSGRGPAGRQCRRRPASQPVSLEHALVRRPDGGALRVIDVLGEDDTGFDRVDLTDSAERALCRVPAGSREAARLVYIEHLEQQEAAARLGLSPSRVSQLLKRLPAGGA